MNKKINYYLTEVERLIDNKLDMNLGLEDVDCKPYDKTLYNENGLSDIQKHDFIQSFINMLMNRYNFSNRKEDIFKKDCVALVNMKSKSIREWLYDNNIDKNKIYYTDKYYIDGNDLIVFKCDKFIMDFIKDDNYIYMVCK